MAIIERPRLVVFAGLTAAGEEVPNWMTKNGAPDGGRRRCQNEVKKADRVRPFCCQFDRPRVSMTSFVTRLVGSLPRGGRGSLEPTKSEP